MSYKYALFDLDGTLTDSAPGIHNCIKYALEKMGREVPGKDILDRFLGPPLVEGFAGNCNMSPAEAEEATRLFRERYTVTGLYENKPYDGVREMLQELKDADVFLATATSKPEDYAVRILKRFKLYEYFGFIGAATFDKSRHDKISVLRYTIEKTGITDLESAIMVGDRANDIEGAHALGIKCIAVLYGYGSSEEFKLHKADMTAHTPAEAALLILD